MTFHTFCSKSFGNILDIKAEYKVGGDIENTEVIKVSSMCTLQLYTIVFADSTIPFNMIESSFTK